MYVDKRAKQQAEVKEKIKDDAIKEIDRLKHEAYSALRRAEVIAAEHSLKVDVNLTGDGSSDWDDSFGNSIEYKVRPDMYEDHHWVDDRPHDSDAWNSSD